MVAMKHYEAVTTIAADAETVWGVITDGAAYTAWDSGVTRLEGDIRDGEKIKVHAAVGGDRAFPVRVSLAPDRRSMTWSGGMPLGLFRGVRTFTLTPSGSTTRLRVREEFSGPLLGMIWKSMPDLGPSFTQFVEGARARAESLVGGPRP